MDDRVGNGRSAWNALVDKYGSVTLETCTSCYLRLTRLKLKREQDPEDYLYERGELRDRLTFYGKLILVERCKGVLLSGLTEHRECVKEKTYIDRDFGMDAIRTIMRNVFVDKLSRSDSSTAVHGVGVGRGIAMQSSGWYSCGGNHRCRFAAKQS